jgi:hypothetical protein
MVKSPYAFKRIMFFIKHLQEILAHLLLDGARAVPQFFKVAQGYHLGG